jgi:hypothetical protein
MMFEHRKKRLLIEILVIILLLIIGWVLYVWLSDNDVAVTPASDALQIDLQEEESSPTVSEQEIKRTETVRAESTDVISLSKTFVERYGSYSNEANFSNLVDVLPLMSESFRSETESFIETAVAPEEYYGVSTQVIIVDVSSEDDEVATVLVTVQREEAIGSPQDTSVKFQEIILKMIKEQGSWYVDSATWQ